MKNSSFFLFLFFCFTLNIAGQVWEPMGPAPQNSRSFGPVSGRIWGIAVSPAHKIGVVNHSAMMFLATDRGGIWRSSNFTTATPVWEPVFDNLPQLYWAETITVDPNEPNRLLVPAGNKMILVSENSGTDWDTLASNVFGAAGPGLQVIIDPTQADNKTMYGLNGSSNWGSNNVFRSRNEGASWQVLNFPIIATKTGLEYTVSETNGLTLFTGLKKSGIWHSIDGGDTWTAMPIELRDITTGKPVNSSEIGRISFAADHRPGTANGVFAIISNSKSSHILNIFKLRGDTWVPIATNLQQADNYVSASNHGINSSSTFQSIALADNGFLYFAAGDVQYSPVYQKKPSDSKWYSVENGGSFRPHTDIPALAFYDNRMYAGTDGGIYRFTPLAGGQPGRNTWESLNTGTLQTQLIEGIGIHPSNPDIILCGAWDNGIGRKENGVWTEPFGDDNARILFDPAPSGGKQYAYTTGVDKYDFFFLSRDGGKTWEDKSPPEIPAQEANVGWHARFAIHPVDPSRIVIGIDRIYESRDKGENWSPAKSPIFVPTGKRPVTMRPFGSPATAIAYGHYEEIWVAYGNQLFRTTNASPVVVGGMPTWESMNNGVNFGGAIIKIVVDPKKPDDVFLAVSNNSIWKKQTYASILGGSPGWGWVNITSNLPNWVTLNTLSLVPASTTMSRGLFVGTSAGVYISSDNGVRWRSFNLGLPRGDVRDIQFYAPSNLLYAGLHGRGVYRTSVAEVLDLARKTDIKINLQKRECMLNAVEGSDVVFGYSVTDFGISNPLVKTTWEIVGGTTNPGETFDGKEIRVNIPVGVTEIGVSLVLEFPDGLTISKYVEIPVFTQKDGDGYNFLCNLLKERKKPLNWWQWNPRMWEWDAKADDAIRRKVPKEYLIQEKKEVLEYLKLLTREIEMYK